MEEAVNKPKKEASIKKNYIFNSTHVLISILVPMFTAPYVYRILMPDGIGIKSYVAANVSYFTLFGMLGIAGYGQREAAIVRDDKKKVSELFWELQLFHTMAVLVSLIAYFILIIFSKDDKFYYILSLISIMAGLADINWLFQAYERFVFLAIRNSTIQILLLISTFVFVKEKSDLPIYIVINCMAVLLANVSVWFELRKYVSPVPFKKLRFKKHIKSIMIFFIPTVAASVYSVLDKSVIKWITGSAEENGYYEQAYLILMIINAVVQSLSTVSSPRMSNTFVHGTRDEFVGRLNMSLRFMLFISIPLATGMAGVANRFIPLYFGKDYMPAVNIVYIFMPLVLMLGFSTYLDGMYLIPAGKRKQSATVICIGAIGNFFLNIYMVSKLAAIGAAIATLATEAFIAGCFIVLSRSVIDFKRIGGWLLRYVIAGALLFAVVKAIDYGVQNALLCIALQVVSGACVYFMVLIVIKDDLMLEMIATVKRILNRGAKKGSK